MTNNDNIAFQIVLGLFVGIAATSALENLLALPDAIWLVASFFIIFISIVFIYSMMLDKVKINWKKELVRMANIFLVSFLPISIRKMLLTVSQAAQASTPAFAWSFNFVILHLLLIGAFLIIWSFMKKEESEKCNKAIIVAGVAIIIVSLILWGINQGYGGSITNFIKNAIQK